VHDLVHAMPRPSTIDFIHEHCSAAWRVDERVYTRPGRARCPRQLNAQLGAPAVGTASTPPGADVASPMVAVTRFASRFCSPRNNWRCWDAGMSPTVSASSRAHSCSTRPRSAVPAGVDSTRVARPSTGSGRRRTKPARSRRCTVRVIEAESVSNSAARSVWRCGPVSQRCMSNSSCPGCRPRPCSNWRIRVTCSRVTRIRALLTGPSDAADDDATWARAAGRVTTLTTITPADRDAPAHEGMPPGL
jgi:hypothetical protein